MTTHKFDSTGDAYDACQCDENIKDGDILMIAREAVVGIAGTWPVAVTVKAGVLHFPADGKTVADVCDPAAVEAAKAIAQAKGWEVRP